MSKITKIQFKNYRAFYGDYTDSQNTLDTQGKNVLIYGENGSGKSSVYQGLKDFFQAVKTEREPEKSPKHLKSLGTEDYEIKVTFEGNKEISFLNGGDLSDTLIAQTFELNSFLSYKELLRTHLVSQENFSTQFFDLVFYTLLNNRKFGNTTLQEEVESILKLSDTKKITEKLEKLSVFFEKEIKKIETKTKDFLKYFTKEEIKIKFSFSKNLSIKNNLLLGNLDLEISYFGNKNIPHLEILNEARLSALAISIFLAGITTNSITTATNLYKILFLDDIFIGLDMSNRLPLLDILKTEFNGYQIFMTTYDRAWFETARQWLENKAKGDWKFFEMYVDDFTNSFDVPVVLETKTYIEKAEYYLSKHDYPACGSYLRKACEEHLERILKPHCYKADINTTEEGYITQGKKLNALVTNLKDFCQEEGLNYTDFENLGIYKDAVLNPLSHNDIKNPIFKQELIDVMKVLKELEKIELKEIPNTKGKTPLFQFDINNSAEIQVKEKILLLISNGQTKLLSKCKILLKNIRKNGVDDTSKNQEFASLQKIYEFLCNEFGITYELNDLSQKLNFRDKTLQQLINEL